MKNLGVMSMGVKLPILKEGDNLTQEIINSVLNIQNEIPSLTIEDKDIIAVTESIVARTQGNYATVDEMVDDIKHKFGVSDTERIDEIALYQPVLSRNRFAILLRAFARASKKVTIQFTLPSDEVGNELVDKQWWFNLRTTTEDEIVQYAKTYKHKFTGVNYISYYESIVTEEGAEFHYMLRNDTEKLKSNKNVVICNVHDREMLKAHFQTENNVVLTLQDFLQDKCEYGLLGSNKVDEETVKLFPRNGMDFVNSLQKAFLEKTNKNVECLIYGDGGFKCPVCGVWEELDPVISPAFTNGLKGTPNEIKLKYFADNEYSATNSGEQLNKLIKDKIKTKKQNLCGEMDSQGTTPRQYSDLLGSLADLTSGSGDKGTPVIWIKNYFNNYADE